MDYSSIGFIPKQFEHEFFDCVDFLNSEKIKKYSCFNFQKVFLSRIEGLNMGLVISQKPKEQERGNH